MQSSVSGMKFIAVSAMALLLAACASDKSMDAQSMDAQSSDTAMEMQAATAPTPVVEEETMAGPAAGSQEHLVANVGDRVFFAYDSSELSSAARRTLRAQAEWMRENAGVSVVLEGHADERGTREYNLALGERRAAAAKNYLVALGISSNRVSTISYGKERPVALGSNESAWRQNRRAVMVVG